MTGYLDRNQRQARASLNVPPDIITGITTERRRAADIYFASAHPLIQFDTLETEMSPGT